jgi:hypothetical protein
LTFTIGKQHSFIDLVLLVGADEHNSNYVRRFMQTDKYNLSLSVGRVPHVHWWRVQLTNIRGRTHVARPLMFIGDPAPCHPAPSPPDPAMCSTGLSPPHEATPPPRVAAAIIYTRPLLPSSTPSHYRRRLHLPRSRQRCPAKVNMLAM